MKLVAAKCPNCGAKIDVDKDSDSTKCEYCKSKILIDDAIQKVKIDVSGNVEISNMSSFDKLLRLAHESYYDRDYEDALEKYKKAQELNPDDPVVVLRVGLCSVLLSNYNGFNVDKAQKAMKKSYRLLNDDLKKNKNIINSFIDETSKVIELSVNNVFNFYKSSHLSLEGVNGVISRLNSCLDIYIYLYSIVVDNDIPTYDSIYFKIINVIDNILSNKAYWYYNGVASYNLNSDYRKKIVDLKQKYISLYSSNHPGVNINYNLNNNYSLFKEFEKDLNELAEKLNIPSSVFIPIFITVIIIFFILIIILSVILSS